MKSINIYIIFLLILSLLSCKDDYSVDLSNRQFVRLDKTSVSITAGEKYIIKAVVDTLGSANKSLSWSILNPEIASIEEMDDKTAIITGLNEGHTVIKVESTDGSIKYFSDLTITKDRVIKILAIGNSFSEDALEKYLYDLSISAGYKVIIGNIFVEEQSMEEHWNNALENNSIYQFRLIGSDGSLNKFENKSIMEVVYQENWDYISFQESSSFSGIIDGYLEYLPKLTKYVKSVSTNPELKTVLHQTWAYPNGSSYEGFEIYDRSQIKMYNAIVNAVSKVEELIDIVVPVGTAIQNARTTYLDDNEYLGDLITYNDRGNLSLERGRFIAASTWFESIFREDVIQNLFVLNSLSLYENKLIKTAAHLACKDKNKVTLLKEFRFPEGNSFILDSPIYIDFGPISSNKPFNNYGHPTDPKLSDLKDENGVSTNFVIEVKKPFTGTLERGLENDLGFPKTASEDMFFSDGNNSQFATSSFALSNFNPNLKYTFVFYGSINDTNTETQFRVVGKDESVVYLVNDHNIDRVAIVPEVSPSNYGTFIIELTKGPNNNHWAGFFSVNAMVIKPGD